MPQRLGRWICQNGYPIHNDVVAGTGISWYNDTMPWKSVYGLYDLTAQTCRYIGVSQCPEKRFRSHQIMRVRATVKQEKEWPPNLKLIILETDWMTRASGLFRESFWLMIMDMAEQPLLNGLQRIKIAYRDWNYWLEK